MRARLAGAACLLLACQSPPVAPAPVAPPAPAPTASAGPPPPSETEQIVERMLARVVQARSLKQLRPVASRSLDRKALIAQVREKATSDTPREVIVAQGVMLQALGLIPPAYDYEKGFFELLESQLAGYYEPDDKTMYLARDLGVSEAEATLAHELVHALQDQHYDLGPKLRFRENAGDEPVALHALAEGDATSAMLDVTLHGALAIDTPDSVLLEALRVPAALSPSVAAIPPVLRTSLLAPYIDGLRFVHALRRRGGWAAVDQAWRSPPTTTEQLLHLDKYDAREPAVAVPAPPTDALEGGFRVVFADLSGEQNVRITFEEWGSEREADEAARGWGGDRIALLSRKKAGDDEQLVTWWLRFDGKPSSCVDAQQAFAVARKGLVPQAKKGATLACRERADLGPLAVAIHGCDVVIVAGPFVGSSSKRSAGSCKQVEPWLSRWAASPTP